MPFERILVAIDGSEPSDHAFTKAVELALATNGTLHALAVEGPLPAYAATIHKSQGSEYPAVVIPIMTQHYAMLQRNLLYTGITRGKRLVVLIGQKKAVAIAVRNVSGRRRWSKLDQWLSAFAITGEDNTIGFLQ